MLCSILAIILVGCSQSDDNNSDDIPVTTEITSAEETVISAKIPMEQNDFEFLAPGYSLKELGYKIEIPLENCTVDPDLLKLYEEQGYGNPTYGATSSYPPSNIEGTKIKSPGYNSVGLNCYSSSVETGWLDFGYYMAFKESDFDFSLEQVNEKAVFHKKLVELNLGDYFY